MATELYFVRHAESLDNVAGVSFDEMAVNEEGFLDNPLSELGENQALAAADWLFERVRADAVFSSGLTRTDMTAAPIAEKYGVNIQELKELREVEVNKDTLGKIEIENTLSRTLYKLPGGKKIRNRIIDAGVVGAFAAWSTVGMKGFEPIEDIKARARYCLETLAARPEKRIIAVAHCFFLCAMILELTEMSPLNFIPAPKPLGLLPNCSVTCVIAHPPRFRIRYAARKSSDIT